jgi:recombination protein RecR
MDPLAQLASLFERFPGIGPRQAFRFVQFLLRHPGARRELVDALGALGTAVHQCPECRRFHASSASAAHQCGLCANPNRDDTLLAVVASDADVSALERSGTYSGRYFVLGGTVSLASEKASHLRIPELIALAQKKNPAEIILAFPANPEGDATAIRVREDLEEAGMHVTMLGRGLSTGSELEYADAETLKTALQNRK